MSESGAEEALRTATVQRCVWSGAVEASRSRGGEHGRGVAVDERAVDADALGDVVSDGQERTARGAHSDADALCVGHGRLRVAEAGLGASLG